MKTIALIPAKANSQRVVAKNMRQFAGKALVEWTFLESKKSLLLDSIYISTDSSDIANLALKYGVEVPFIRPEHLATSSATAQSVVEHFLSHYRKHISEDPITLVYLQPTSPLRTSRDIDGAIQQFTNYEWATSLVSYSKLPSGVQCSKLMQKFTDQSICVRTNYKICEGKELDCSCHSVIVRNGPAILIAYCDDNFKTITQEPIAGYEMPWWRSIDIDTEDDFKLAELITLGITLSQQEV